MTEPKQPASPELQGAWSGRFSEPVSALVKRYTASVFFDRRMWRQDIRASLAHARMLGTSKASSPPPTVAAIERGMAQIQGEIERVNFSGISMTRTCISTSKNA
jgi:argininosuccinate lyase